jgi:hypothetical protein
MVIMFFFILLFLRDGRKEKNKDFQTNNYVSSVSQLYKLFGHAHQSWNGIDPVSVLCSLLSN